MCGFVSVSDFFINTLCVSGCSFETGEYDTMRHDRMIMENMVLDNDGPGGGSIYLVTGGAIQLCVIFFLG